MTEETVNRVEIQRNIRNILARLGEDVSREGLRETPQRVARAMMEDWFGGYGKDPCDVLKCFEDGSEGTDQMVMVKDIDVYSHCEHHMAPFFGKAAVAYIPQDNRIVGLSKLARVVDIFARRLQVQERLTNQIADALHYELRPLGVGVLLRCRHLCMESRGVQRKGSVTVSSALRGAMLEDPKARAEFLRLAG